MYGRAFGGSELSRQEWRTKCDAPFLKLLLYLLAVCSPSYCISFRHRYGRHWPICLNV